MELSELGRLADAERMIPNAPVAAQRGVEINAPLETVWNTLTEVPEWAKWYPYLKNAKLDGPFRVGARLTYGGLFKHDLRIGKIRERELVMIYGMLMGFTGITRWELEKIAQGWTKVSFGESSDGFLIGALYGNRSLGKHLENWLDKLKLEAERLSGGAALRGAPNCP